MADYRSIIIKKADKGSCVVVWDRNDYIVEAEKQLGDKNIYQDVNFSDRILRDLVDKSNKMFRSLMSHGKTEKELKYFTYEYQKATNLGKMYLLPKIHKRLSNVPGRPVISNCGTPAEKVSEFLDFQLKPVMQSRKSYIKDSGDFIRKIKDIYYISSNVILITANVVGLYPSIPHDSGLKALKNNLDKRKNQNISTEFVLKNNYFEFNGKVKQQISGTAIATKCAPTYACTYMDEFENEFFNLRSDKPLVWLRYIDDVFLYGHMEKKSFTYLWRI